MSSLLARVPDRVRHYLDSWRFWFTVALAGIVAVLILGVYTVVQQERQSERSRADLCDAVNDTRMLLRDVLELSKAQTLAGGADGEHVDAFYDPLIALAHPVDCSEVVRG